MKKTAVNVVKFVVTFGILYLMFKKFQIGFDDISTAISTSKAEWFVVSILTQVAAITFSIFRWRVLLVAQGLNVPISHVIKTYLVGRFLGTFTPTGLGLEAYKAYDIARYTQRGAPSVTVVFVEKFLTLLALSILMLITLPMVQLNTAFIGAFFIFFLVVLLILLILIFKASILLNIVRILPFTDKTEGPANKAVESFQTFKNRKGAMGAAIIFGVLVYISLFSTFFTNGMALRIGGAQPGELYSITSSEKTKETLANMNIQWIKQNDAENERLEVFLTDSESEALIARDIDMTLVSDDKYTRKGLGLGDVLTVGPLTQIATMIPLSIAGIGLREGAFIGLLRSKGVWVAQRAVLAATMWYFVSISVNIFGAIIFLTRRTDYHTKISKEEFQRVTKS
ncbi:MAG: flippase-like domain-containing protein [candidate division Zixibacteria bacterium]|nr:flippase-like domain-containing protein [candidate division Zixibacteria bacterium]